MSLQEAHSSLVEFMLTCCRVVRSDGKCDCVVGEDGQPRCAMREYADEVLSWERPAPEAKPVSVVHFKGGRG